MDGGRVLNGGWKKVRSDDMWVGCGKPLQGKKPNEEEKEVGSINKSPRVEGIQKFIAITWPEEEEERRRRREKSVLRDKGCNKFQIGGGWEVEDWVPSKYLSGL